MVDIIKNTIYNCGIIRLPKVNNRAGNITALENNITVPFEVKRVYYLYDIPGGEGRGGHAHKDLHQLVVAASGSFDVILDDGLTKRTVTLNRPYNSLYIVSGIWREISNFSSGSICLVLASELYDEQDYIRDYNYYLTYKNDSSSI